MSTPAQPVGQLAYQGSFVKNYGNAMRCFAQTANRYGGGSAAFENVANSTNPVDCYPMRARKAIRVVPVGGQVSMNIILTSAGATGFVANDLVTFVGVNNGRPIVVKVTHVTAGNPDAFTLIDPGSGLVGGGSGLNEGGGSGPPANVVLTQASTTGVGVTGVWTLNGACIPYGWVFPQPNPAA
jgi:hypothetical protein